MDHSKYLNRILLRESFNSFDWIRTMIGKAVQTRDAYHRIRSSFTKIPREKDEDTQSTGITARQ
eukprot:scaffold40589_cov311-Skeletonema_dohrnii-CCMP3373.AAC.1